MWILIWFRKTNHPSYSHYVSQTYFIMSFQVYNYAEQNMNPDNMVLCYVCPFGVLRREGSIRKGYLTQLCPAWNVFQAKTISIQFSQKSVDWNSWLSPRQFLKKVTSLIEWNQCLRLSTIIYRVILVIRLNKIKVRKQPQLFMKL